MTDHPPTQPKRRRASGTNTRRATEHIAIRLTPEERTRLALLAAEQEMGLSTYVRTAALAAGGLPVHKPRRKLQRADLTELREALRLLGNLTGNVNQMAYQANAYGNLPIEKSCQTVSAVVGDLKTVIRRALGVEWI